MVWIKWIPKYKIGPKEVEKIFFSEKNADMHSWQYRMKCFGDEPQKEQEKKWSERTERKEKKIKTTMQQWTQWITFSVPLADDGRRWWACKVKPHRLSLLRMILLLLLLLLFFLYFTSVNRALFRSRMSMPIKIPKITPKMCTFLEKEIRETQTHTRQKRVSGKWEKLWKKETKCVS